MQETDLIRTIIDTYQTSNKYVILEAHGVYDVPGEEGYVYEFVEIALCPVQLSDDKLVCDASKQLICGRVKICFLVYLRVHFCTLRLMTDAKTYTVFCIIPKSHL